MRYLPFEIEEKRKSQYVVPKSGVDIPYLRKYFTNADPFYVKLTDGIAGTVGTTPNNTYFVPTTWDSDWVDYDDLCLYLINTDATEVYVIADISAGDEWVETTTAMPSGAAKTYYIAKYYQSSLLSCPTISQSSKRQGELARIGNINFSIANSENATYSTGTFLKHTTNTLEIVSGGLASTSNIGKIIILQYSDAEYERIILDADGTYIYLNADIDNTAGALPCFVITNNYLSDDFYTYPYIEERAIEVYSYLADSISDTVLTSAYQQRMFNGLIQECNNITNTQIDFIGYDTENYITKDVIGNLISSSDGVLINGATIESLGEMKPLLFGVSETYGQLNSDHELNLISNNMSKLVYLGLDAVSGKKKYLISENAITQTGITGVQTTSGTVTTGKYYEIVKYVVGDDFTNIGASSNETGEVFLATGTTPTTWTNGTSVKPTGLQASGSLVVGKEYTISSYQSGDDFTNVGASENLTGETFVATGTAPTTWTNGSELKISGNFFYKNQSGRMCAIDEADITFYSDGDGENAIISIGTYSSGDSSMIMHITDYWFGGGNVDNVNPTSPAVNDVVENLEDSCDNNNTTSAHIKHQTGVSDVTERTQGFNIVFNEYNDTFISIDSVYVYATYSTSYVASATGGTDIVYTVPPYMQINGQSKSGANAKTTEYFGTETATRAGIADNVPVITSGGYYIPAGANPAAYDINIYEVFKKVNAKIDTVEEDIEIFANYSGYKYPSSSSWISGRAENDASPNGGYYSYTHDNDDDTGVVIQNPIGVIEAMLRDTTFGMSLTNSDIDLDSFNRASISRTGWETVFQLQNQVGSEELLQDMCEQYACVLYERDDKVACFAYDNSYPFTCNNMVFNDSRLVADSNILDAATEFEIERKFKTGASVTSTLQTLASGFEGVTGKFGALRFSSAGLYLSLQDGSTSANTYSTPFPFLPNTEYLVKVKKIGTLITYDINGATDTDTATSAHNISIIEFGCYLTFQNNFYGTDYYAKIWSGGDRTTGTLVCDLEAINEKFVDKTGGFYFTEYNSGAGDITFELAGKGTFDYYATVSDGEFSKLPIIKDSFRFMKNTDNLITKLIANYYYNNDTGNSQASSTYTDTTIGSTVEEMKELTKISDATTVGYLKDEIFNTLAKRANQCQFTTTVAAMHLELFDIVNIRHPLLRNRFSNMTSKKWLITSVETDTECMETTITAVELL